MKYTNTTRPSSPEPEENKFLVAIVGVTFDNRQEALRKLEADDDAFVWLWRMPSNPHDPNAIAVVRENGEMLGHLDRQLAAQLAPRFDLHGEPIAAKYAVVGDESQGWNLVLGILFSVPPLQVHAAYP